MRNLILALVLALALPGQGWAAVVADVDAACALSAITPPTTADCALTITGGQSNYAATVAIWTYNAIAVSSVTMGGQSGTLIQSTTSGGKDFELWGVKNLTSGAKTAAVLFAATVTDDIQIIVSSFYNVDQTTPFDGAVTNADFATTLAITSVTSTSGDLTHTAIFHTGSAAGDLTTDRTLTNNAIGTIATDVGPGTGSTVHTWSTVAAGNWIVGIGTNINAASAAPPTAFFRLRVQP